MSSRPRFDDKASLSVICIATFLALVVFTAPLTTLEAMTAALTLSSDQQAWVMSGMPLGAACGLLTAGALGDTLGRKRIFTAGLWVTVLSSLVAALSSGGNLLILMRITQGLGSAGIMACGLGLLGQIYQGEARRRAAAIWAASLGGGVAAGPIIASLLLPLAGWAGIHWVIVASSTALALAASAYLPESPRSRQRVDLWGSLILIVALACLLSALTEIRVGSIQSVLTLAILGVGLLAAFVLIENRVRNPILMLDLFQYADFTGATIAAFASGAGVLALMSLVPTVLVRGYSVTPISAALILIAWSGLTVIAALLSHRLPSSLSSRQRVIVAIIGCSIGQTLLLALGKGASWPMAIPGLLVAGIANGLLNAALGHEAVQTVPAERTAMGSAVNNTARYLGSAAGITVVSLLISTSSTEAFFRGWQYAVLLSAGASLLGALSMIAAANGSKVS